MARILFAWELGGGLGHTLVHVGLARRLRAAGHQVIFAIRDLAQAEGVIGRHGFHYLQAPVRMRAVTEPLPNAVSYPQILHNIGFSDAAGLLSQVKAWRLLYTIVQPAMVVFDHSPTALLAAADLAAHKVHIGTGFTVPPPLVPFPRLAPATADTVDPAVVEAGVLESMNRVREVLGLAPLANVAAILAVDEEVLLTFRELDHYPQRDGGRYWGDGPADSGQAPRWPALPGKRVFAYLKPFKNIGSLLEALAARRLPTLIYGPQLPGALVRRHGSASLRFVGEPLNLNQVGQECDLAILNGTHGSTAAQLLAGRPSLQLPLYLEQLITAVRVQELGAGLAAPRLQPGGMAAKLEALLEDERYAVAAGRFARAHDDFSLDHRDAAIAARLTAALS